MPLAADFCGAVPLPLGASSGTPHRALTTGASGAARPPSANSPWKTCCLSAALSIGTAAAKALAMPAVSGAGAVVVAVAEFVVFVGTAAVTACTAKVGRSWLPRASLR